MFFMPVALFESFSSPHGGTATDITIYVGRFRFHRIMTADCSYFVGSAGEAY